VKLPGKPKPPQTANLRASSKATYAIIQTKALLAGKSVEDLLRWAEANIHGGLPRGTVLTRYSALKHLLLERGYSAADIKATLPSIKLYVADKPRGPLSNEQVEVFDRGVREYIRSPPMKALLSLLRHTGMRVSEACNLKRADIVMDDGNRCLQVLGKGGKYRNVPLTPAANKILDAYLQRFNPAPPWLFPGEDPDHQLTRLAVNAACRRLRNAFPELGGRFSPHVLRHTFATRAHERGVSVLVISRILGHATLAQTERYTKPSSAFIATQIAKLK
jgi:integrase